INNSNSIPVANNGTSQGGPVGFTSVALRGLDPGASLVLLDGRRVTRVLGGTFVDINTIPMSAVESIEILKSGASAVYGADAVAGTSLLEFAGAPSGTNGLAPANTYLYNGSRIRGPAPAPLPGFNFNLFSSSYPEQERWGGYAAFSDKICGDELQIFGDFYYADVKQHDELAPIATGSFNTKGQPTLAIPPQTDLGGVAPPNTPRFAGQPEGAGAGEVQTPTPPNAFNPFNPFNQIIAGGTRARIFDFGNRLVDTENEAYLATVGVRGDKVFGTNWGYEGAFRYSQIYTIAQIQTASASRFNRIMNAADSIHVAGSSDFIGTTVPYNPFTDFNVPLTGTAFQDQLKNILFARANVRDLTKSALTTADFRVYTTDLFELPAGGVGFAMGADWRREQFDFNPDDTDENGDQIGVGQAKTSFGGRKAYGIFAETQIPITSPKMAIPGAYSLEFNASG